MKTLVSFFRKLTDGQLRNLLFHVKNKTPICCGRDFQLYTDGFGGG